MALVAGILIVIGQLLVLPFDPNAHVATSTDPQYQIGGVVYLAGFGALLLAVIGASARVIGPSTKLGTIATITAIIGTFLLGGDLWFETFAVPWLADEAPNAFDTDPTMLLAIGAIGSYLTFAIGWALFGYASLRARVMPKPVAILMIVGGVIGFKALLAPFAIPLALAVGSMGIWMMRSRKPALASTVASGLTARVVDPEPAPVA
jgi:hypothetical protein